MLTIFIFIVILALLVFVHELGHFLLAEAFGIRVDEFALGFPPRIISKQFGETKYSLNLVPFGGYVKIFGEEASDVRAESPDRSRSLVQKNRAIQATVLVGGVIGNIIFAWILLSLSFMTGAPVSTEQYSGAALESTRLLIINVLPNSPADQSGMKAGDVIRSLYSESGEIIAPTTEAVQQFISAREGKEITFELEHGSETRSIVVIPKQGVIGQKAGIGISMDLIGTLKLSLFPALAEGGKRTIDLSIAIVKALSEFFYQAFTWQANLAEITGPVGIAVLVGSAQALGFFYLVSFTAIISLNLAIINLLPFPALDGGRLFFVMIESVVRRPLNARFQRVANSIGLMVLLILLVVITYKDVVHLL